MVSIEFLKDLGLMRGQQDLTTHNIRKRQTSMFPAGFEPTIPESERSEDYKLDDAATRISINQLPTQNSRAFPSPVHCYRPMTYGVEVALLSNLRICQCKLIHVAKPHAKSSYCYQGRFN